MENPNNPHAWIIKAVEEIEDEGVFTSDQIRLLTRMIGAISTAINKSADNVRVR